MSALEKWHGTAGGYTNHKCRCDACTAAWRDYHRTRGYMRTYRARLAARGLNTRGKPFASEAQP